MREEKFSVRNHKEQHNDFLTNPSESGIGIHSRFERQRVNQLRFYRILFLIREFRVLEVMLLQAGLLSMKENNS